MGLVQQAKSKLDMLMVCVEAIETLSSIFKSVNDKAHAIKLAEDIINNVRAGWSGTISPAEIRSHLAKLDNDLRAGTAAADAAADAKYGPKP